MDTVDSSAALRWRHARARNQQLEQDRRTTRKETRKIACHLRICLLLIRWERGERVPRETEGDGATLTVEDDVVADWVTSSRKIAVYDSSAMYEGKIQRDG